MSCAESYDRGASVWLFCDGSLGELQHCFRDAVSRCSTDNSQRMSRLHDFRTVDDVKSIVNEMDFERFVVSVETEVDWYDDLHSLLRSIKNIGAGTVSGGSGSGLGWRGYCRKLTFSTRSGMGRTAGFLLRIKSSISLLIPGRNQTCDCTSVTLFLVRANL